MYEQDFVDETTVEFEIEKRKFKYKPVTAGEENDWLNEYIGYDKEGKMVQQMSKLNECKVRNLIEVPYDKEAIKKMLGIDKEWSQLNKDQRWLLLKKLKPQVFNKIILKIKEIDKGKVEIKKN